MTLEPHEIATLERRLLSLPDELYQARLAHAAAKARALAADQDYRRRKSEAYVECSRSEKSHWRIENIVSTEPAIRQAQSAREEAELDVFRASIEAERLHNMLAVAHTLIRDCAPSESTQVTPR